MSGVWIEGNSPGALHFLPAASQTSVKAGGRTCEPLEAVIRTHDHLTGLHGSMADRLAIFKIIIRRLRDPMPNRCLKPGYRKSIRFPISGKSHYQANQPPSMESVSPVTKLAASEARKTQTSPTSRGSPPLLIGIFLIFCSRILGLASISRLAISVTM